LGAALALAIALTQCRPVADNLAGVNVGDLSRTPTNCIAACAQAYGDSMQVESALHVTNVQACAGDSSCLEIEATRFQLAVARITAGRQACQDGCHHQGGGSGGR
jgi:hypothetical protein